MKIELEVWQLITLLLGFFGACAGAGRLLLTQMLRHIDLRFRAQEDARSANHEQVQHRLDKLEESAKLEAGEWQRVEREFLQMQRDMAAIELEPLPPREAVEFFRQKGYRMAFSWQDMKCCAWHARPTRRATSGR